MNSTILVSIIVIFGICLLVLIAIALRKNSRKMVMGILTASLLFILIFDMLVEGRLDRDTYFDATAWTAILCVLIGVLPLQAIIPKKEKKPKQSQVSD